MAGVCKLCGAPYQDGAKFCVECGAVLISRIGENEATVKADEQKENAVEVENNAQTAVESVENTTSTNSPENENTVSETTVLENKVSETYVSETYVSNTYGAANADIPTAYTNPYASQNATPNGGNPYSNPYANPPYGGANYNAPNGSNPYGSGNYNAPNGNKPYGGGNYNAPYGQNPGAPNGYNQYGVPYNPNAVPQPPKKEINIGLLVFSIINLILGCCSCTGFIFGGAGLAFAMMAKNAKTDGDTENYNKISMILNIIGVILTVIVIVAAFAMGLLEGFASAY